MESNDFQDDTVSDISPHEDSKADEIDVKLKPNSRSLNKKRQEEIVYIHRLKNVFRSLTRSQM